jgi:hypothetical protein
VERERDETFAIGKVTLEFAQVGHGAWPPQPDFSSICTAAPPANLPTCQPANLPTCQPANLLPAQTPTTRLRLYVTHV